MILKLDKDSNVWSSGVRAGDIISSVNRIPVSSVADFVSLIQTQNERILLKVHRNGSSAFVFSGVIYFISLFVSRLIHT